VTAELENVNIVFCSDYYDMPLTGLARYAGELCWFRCDEETEIYKLYRLDETQLANELERMRAFEELVGTHWSYEVPIVERKQRPLEFQRKFYERYSAATIRQCWRENEDPTRVLGVFERFANSMRRF
jgi:hypothetical protein